MIRRPSISDPSTSRLRLVRPPVIDLSHDPLGATADEVTSLVPRGVLRPRGELDIATVPALLAEGYAELSRDPCLVVDMRAVTFIDVLGVEALLMLRDRARRRGGSVIVAGAQLAVSRVIVLLRLGEDLELHECVGCALLAQADERARRD